MLNKNCTIASPDSTPKGLDARSELAEACDASSRWAVLLSLSLATCLFLYRFGFRSLDPTNIGFIFHMGGDIATSYLGWAFLREAPWSFPLGKIPDYFAPIGTYSAITGANQLLGLPLKLLSPLLPVDFQFTGWWLLACNCLQAYFAYRLMRLITSNIIEQTLGVGFFLLTPTLLLRILLGHETLCAHWLILASFTIYFENYSVIYSKKVFLYWCLLIFCAFVIMPYFTPMIIGLALSFTIGHLIFSPSYRLQLLVSMAVYPLIVLGSFALLGFFSAHISYQLSPILPGYGVFSLNLNSFINPLEWSSFLPALPYRLGQLEGFNYLGLGVIILLFWSICYVIAQRYKFRNVKYILPFIMILMLFFVYAISQKITWGNTLVFSYYLPEPLLKMVDIFRCSGRFGWPLVYAILYGALFGVTRMHRKTWSIMVMAACLVIQFADIYRMLYVPAFHEVESIPSPLKSPLWQSVGTNFNKIVIYPPFSQAITNEDDYKYLSLYAYKHHLSINTGYVARLPLDKIQIYKNELQSELQKGELDPKSIYIFVNPPESETLTLFSKWDQCAMVDGYIVYTTNNHFVDNFNRLKIESLTLYDFFKKYEHDTILIAARECQAPVLLPQEVKNYLQEKGSQLPHLLFPGSYVGIFSQGFKIFEKINEKSAVKIALRKGELLGSERLTHPIELDSAGVPFGNKTSIKVAGEEHSRNRGGLNIVVLNKEGGVIVSTTFNGKTDLLNLCTRADPTRKIVKRGDMER